MTKGTPTRIRPQNDIFMLLRSLGLSPDPAVAPAESYTLISLDFENCQGILVSGDHPKTRYEMGVAILDSSSLMTSGALNSAQSATPIQTCQFAHGQASCISSARERSIYGTTTEVRDSDHMHSCFEALIPRDKGLIFVGHAIDNEWAILDRWGFSTDGIIATLDTSDFSNWILGVPHPSLENLLKLLGCPFDSLHCAANDAHFTLRALVLLGLHAWKNGALLSHKESEHVAPRIRLLRDMALKPLPPSDQKCGGNPYIPCPPVNGMFLPSVDYDKHLPVPKKPQIAPKKPQPAPKTPQFGPTRPPTAPKTSQAGPTRPQTAPKTSQSGPTRPRPAPKTAKSGPTKPQPASKKPNLLLGEKPVRVCTRRDKQARRVQKATTIQKKGDGKRNWDRPMCVVPGRSVTREPTASIPKARPVTMAGLKRLVDSLKSGSRSTPSTKPQGVERGRASGIQVTDDKEETHKGDAFGCLPPPPPSLLSLHRLHLLSPFGQPITEGMRPAGKRDLSRGNAVADKGLAGGFGGRLSDGPATGSEATAAWKSRADSELDKSLCFGTIPFGRLFGGGR